MYHICEMICYFFREYGICCHFIAQIDIAMTIMCMHSLYFHVSYVRGDMLFFREYGICCHFITKVSIVITTNGMNMLYLHV